MWKTIFIEGFPTKQNKNMAKLDHALQTKTNCFFFCFFFLGKNQISLTEIKKSAKAATSHNYHKITVYISSQMDYQKV